MIKFILLLIAIIAIVAGGYYYVYIKQSADVVQEQTGAQIEARVNTNNIPPGAVMEDGTIGE